MSESQHVEVRQRTSNGIGTASLVLGILACLVSWIPFLGILGIPVAIIGIILAVIGLVIGLTRRSSTGGAIAGGIVSGLAIVISVTITGTTATAIAAGMNAAQQTVQTEQTSRPVPMPVSAPQPSVATIPATSQESTATAPVVAQPAAVLAPAPVPAPAPAPEGPKEASVEWGTYGPDTYFVQGDMAVKIGPLTVGKVKVGTIHNEQESKEDLLSVTITIKNQSEGKKVDYNTWGSNEMHFRQAKAALSDNFDNTYRLVAFGMMSRPKGQLIRESIYPGKEVTDVLIFEQPVDKASELKLELPAANFGGEGFIRIKIPASVIVK